MPTVELTYQSDAVNYFQNLAQLPYAILLDSCRRFQERGRFDIMSAQPIVLLKTKKNHTEITRENSSEQSTQPLFDLVKSELKKLPIIASELPFTSGALGYYGYDIGRQLEKLPNQLTRENLVPDACIGIYDWSLILDHDLKKCHLVYTHAEQLNEIKNLLKGNVPKKTEFKLKAPFKAEMKREEYEIAFNKIQQHLVNGDCYQVNLCQRFSTQFSGSSFSAYQQLREKSPAPFSAFMNLPEGSILSFSPERFIESKANKVLTQPIKGTSPRHSDPKKDHDSAKNLVNSSKDRAENVMIVDLMRNDLSRSCKPGSIQVPKLFELQSFSNVHHLVSSINGELAEDQHPLDLLKNAFPGGSITGAPKISSMNIIEKLEMQPRSVYCGSIGYCTPDRQMDSNITIRTLLCEGNTIYAYAGGGIVIDSDCEAEYQESLIKISNLLRALDG